MSLACLPLLACLEAVVCLVEGDCLSHSACCLLHEAAACCLSSQRSPMQIMLPKLPYQLSLCGNLLGMHRFCLMHPARSSQLRMTVYCKQHCSLFSVIHHHLSMPISIADPVGQTCTTNAQSYSPVYAGSPQNVYGGNAGLQGA